MKKNTEYVEIDYSELPQEPDYSFPHTWGQHSVWQGLVRFGQDANLLNVGLQWRLPEGVTMPAILSALANLIRAHATLRTVFQETPEGPVQKVTRPTKMPVEIVDIAGERRESVYGEAQKSLARVFDHAHGAQFAFTVFTDRGVPRFVFPSISHLAVDRQGLKVLETTFLKFVNGQYVSPDETYWQPFDQVQLEKTRLARSKGQRACDQWSKALQRTGPHLWGAPRLKGEDVPIIHAKMTSHRAAKALPAAVSRHKATAGSVLLAAVSAAVAAVTGHDGHAAVEIVFANRYLRRAGDYAGPLAQGGVIAAPCSSAGTLTEMVQSIKADMPRAYLSAYWPPYSLQASLRDCGFDDIHDRVTSFLFNNFITEARVFESHDRPVMEDTVFEWLPSWSYMPSHCSFRIGYDEEGRIFVTARVNSRLLSRSMLTRLLSGVESALQAMAEGKSARAGDLVSD
ncbi:condensation domain-containing protein [Nonomuraea sp. NPDC050227]|uniref:condensation domain-containing protein n=1 Tax=Nonomuraea sp. NPDC050227 TaxID=3364360 RepID=UPI0037A9C334